MTKPPAFSAASFGLILCGLLIALGLAAQSARASASVTIPSGSNQSRATIPIEVEGRVATCVLDTGTSAVLVSPWLAQAARLTGGAGTFEVAPDGRTYVDRQTRIAHFGVASYVMRNVPALISSKLTGYSALCGYDFFARFPTLIDRDRALVTLFPPASTYARMRCTGIDLTPHVPLATIEINQTWLNRIVLDSGMAGGGALWDGASAQLRQPLVARDSYQSNYPQSWDGFTCGSVAYVRYAAGAPLGAMPVCTEPRHPDGYNGIIETNLPGVHAMAVDYPHRRICFDMNGASTVRSASWSLPVSGNAWSRFNSLRPPN